MTAWKFVKEINEEKLAGRWPNISYDIDVLPAIDNNLGRPLFLPKVNDGIAMPLDSSSVITQDTTYELPVVGGEPAIRVTARAGTHVTFPPDATDKRLSVTRIATNRVPMALEDGRAASLYISVQPAGAIFDPPLAVTFPNLDAQPANTQVLLMSFDHDAGRYIRVGTGRVSADGKTVTSETGSGIRIGAWHSFPANQPCPEVITLGHIQIGGNPAFEGKAIVSSEAWVEGVRAVPIANPDLASSMSILDYRASLSLPCGRNVLVKMEATTELVVASLLPRYIDHDDSANETDKPLADFGTLYGGSERSTSDILTLNISGLAALPTRSFAWSVSGPNAQSYTPPPTLTASAWSVGEIKPIPGTLLFQVVVELTDHRRFRLIREIEVGIRTDDVVALGWIDPAGIPLSTAGVNDAVQRVMPPAGRDPLRALACGGLILGLSNNRPEIDIGSGFYLPLTLADREYILNWLFIQGGNPDPNTVIAGGDFRDDTGQRVSDTEVAAYFDITTRYKIMSRFQIKYRVRDGKFFGSPMVLKYKAEVGDTPNPCSPIFKELLSFSPQHGPSNRKFFFNDTRASWINDGSPDRVAIRAFNTLSGGQLPPGQSPVCWENIGSQIRFSVPLQTTGFVLVQPYPTYYVYVNGRLSQVSREASRPLGHFYANPYPFGTVPCMRFGRTVPGGRCGDAESALELTSRVPDFRNP